MRLARPQDHQTGAHACQHPSRPTEPSLTLCKLERPVASGCRSHTLHRVQPVTGRRGNAGSHHSRYGALASYKAGLVKPCLARARGFHAQPLGRDDLSDASPLSEAYDAKSDVRKRKAPSRSRVELTQFDGESTHVDLLVIYPAKVRLSDFLPAEFPAISTFWSLRKSKRAFVVPKHRGSKSTLRRRALNPGNAGARRAFRSADFGDGTAVKVDTPCVIRRRDDQANTRRIRTCRLIHIPSKRTGGQIAPRLRGGRLGKYHARRRGDGVGRPRPRRGIGASEGRRSGPYLQGSEQRLDTGPV
jgi:hypothetical protein